MTFYDLWGQFWPFHQKCFAWIIYFDCRFLTSMNVYKKPFLHNQKWGGTCCPSTSKGSRDKSPCPSQWSTPMKVDIIISLQWLTLSPTNAGSFHQKPENCYAKKTTLKTNAKTRKSCRTSICALFVSKHTASFHHTKCKKLIFRKVK